MMDKLERDGWLVIAICTLNLVVLVPWGLR